jgi:hypothetical protein
LFDEILLRSGSAFVVFAHEDLILILKVSQFVGVGGIMLTIIFCIKGVLIKLQVLS